MVGWTSCNPGLAGRSSAKNSPWSSPRFPSRRGWAHVFTRLSACLSRMQKDREKKTFLSAGCADRASLSSLSPASGRPINTRIARPPSRLSGSVIWSALACPRWPRDLRIRNLCSSEYRGGRNSTSGVCVGCPTRKQRRQSPLAKGPTSQALARISRCFSDCFSGGRPTRWVVLPLTKCHLEYFGIGTTCVVVCTRLRTAAAREMDPRLKLCCTLGGFSFPIMVLSPVRGHVADTLTKLHTLNIHTVALPGP